MLFSELYSAYYNAVAAIIKEAGKHPLSETDIRQIAGRYAFGESTLTIPSALKDERWQLLNEDGTSIIRKNPVMPMTILQKRWLKAISLDPRIQLFGGIGIELDDVDPLFTPEDICVFDKYLDGDDYSDKQYQDNFRLILDAIKNGYPLSIEMKNRRGNSIYKVMMPEYLEYSEKDDKFRLIGSGMRLGGTINLGRIISCKPYGEAGSIKGGKRNAPIQRSVIFELTNRRNALERVLLHFAHFEKQAEKVDEDKYLVTVYYDKEDETEIVIRLLSFGPMIKVVAPRHLVDLIKERLINQKSCEQ